MFSALQTQRSQMKGTPMRNRFLITSAAVAVALSSAAAFAQETSVPLVDAVKAATEKYKDAGAASVDGYVPMPCVSGPAGGAMGIHYVNVGYLEDGIVDVTKPEALMYEPRADGTLELLGVEFITFAGPTALQGHLFHFVNAPNRYGLDPFYELHVWAWRANPGGTFADFNPDVSCGAMAGDAHVAH
jgi:hypothetical protein